MSFPQTVTIIVLSIALALSIGGFSAALCMQKKHYIKKAETNRQKDAQSGVQAYAKAMNLLD
jgi:hypothetical protein